MSSDSVGHGQNDWGIIHCIRNDEDEERRVLRLRLRDVPEGIGRTRIKTALERAGRVFGEGDFLWGNHRILPHDEWRDLDQAAAEAITYADLLDEARGEKRVTVRFPIGLHNAAIKAARGQSFNQFCVDVMAAAVGYEQEPLAPALPRLARTRGISEAEMGERVRQMAAEVQPTSSSPLMQKMGQYFAQVAALPPEQQKQRTLAFWSNPKNVQDYHAAIHADFSEEEVARMGEKLGIPVEEVRRRLETTRALPADFLERGLQEIEDGSSEQAKDTTLLLRDVFTGNASVTSPIGEDSEDKPKRHTP